MAPSRGRGTPAGLARAALLLGRWLLADGAKEHWCWSTGEFSREHCCPESLRPVGNPECWWDRGDDSKRSYHQCCNTTGEEYKLAKRISEEIMVRSVPLPYIYAHKIIFALEAHGLLPSRFLLNFGAADGSADGDDPVVPLFKNHGFAGIAIELDAARAQELRRKMPPGVQTVEDAVTPLNVARLLREAGAPDEPGFLKVDIDSYDCAVLLATLRVSRPAVVQVEINSEIPWPVIFGVHYTPDFAHSGAAGPEHARFNRGFAGCSARLAAELAIPFGYDVIGQAGAHDVLLMRSDLRRALLAVDPRIRPDAWTVRGVSQAITVRNMKPYFGRGVGVSWLTASETHPPQQLIRLMEVGVEAACRASQGVSADGTRCAVEYTLGLDAEEFGRTR